MDQKIFIFFVFLVLIISGTFSYPILKEHLLLGLPEINIIIYIGNFKGQLSLLYFCFTFCLPAAIFLFWNSLGIWSVC